MDEFPAIAGVRRDLPTWPLRPVRETDPRAAVEAIASFCAGAGELAAAGAIGAFLAGILPAKPTRKTKPQTKTAAARRTR